MANTKVPLHLTDGLAADDLSNVTPATGRTALEAAPLPINSAGVGQFTTITSAADADPVALPAGGTWAWLGFYVTSATGAVSGMTGGISAGEAEVFSGEAGAKAFVVCWRVS